MRKILVGTDTSAGADLAVQEAARVAEWDSVPNIVLRHAPCSVSIVDTRAAQ